MEVFDQKARLRENKKKAVDIMATVNRGGYVDLEDPVLTRYVARMMGRQMREKVFLGQDSRHRKTRVMLI